MVVRCLAWIVAIGSLAYCRAQIVSPGGAPPPRPAPVPSPSAPTARPVSPLDATVAAVPPPAATQPIVDFQPADVIPIIEQRIKSGRPVDPFLRAAMLRNYARWSKDESPDARFLTALAGIRGWGTPRDLAGGAARLQTVAADGHALANLYAARLARSAATTDDDQGARNLIARAAELRSAAGELHAGLNRADDAAGKGDFPAAEAALRQLAGQGFAPAMTRLAELYLAGLDAPKNVPAARKLLQDAASLGDVTAMRHLARMHVLGTLAKRDGKLAVALLARAAEDGDGRAMLDLSEIYLRSLAGISLDRTAGQRWFGRAVASEDATATAEAALWLVSGNVVEADVQRGADLARQSADVGEPAAFLALASLSDRGIGGATADETAAALWTRRAAATGYARGLAALGARYRAGRGVELNNDRALQLYLKAARLGDVDSVSEIGRRYASGRGGLKQDPKQAFRCFEIAAHAGSTDAMVQMAEAMRTGHGTRRDVDSAQRWCMLAVELGSTKAMITLSNICFDGGPTERNPEQGRGWLRRAADAGDAAATRRLAERYRAGDGMKQDLAYAVELYRNALAAGDQKAGVELGIIARDGPGGMRIDYDEAMRLFQAAADAGEGDGFYGIGSLWARGFGVPEKNQAKAVENYRKAVALGSDKGLLAMGQCLEIGFGVEKDIDAAIEHYELAFEAGERSAAYRLATLYTGNRQRQNPEKALEWARRGIDAGSDDCLVFMGRAAQFGARSYTEARRWYDRAVEVGNTEAMQLIGLMYLRGEGVSRDLQEAKKWFTRAADAGDPRGMLSLGDLAMTGADRNPEEGAQWYRKAAEAGHVPAMVAYGRLLMAGIGVVQNYQSAINWFRNAADAGDPAGMALYGLMLSEGAGVNRPDPEQAAHWIGKSAEQNDPDGLYALGTLYQAGIVVEKNPARAAEAYRRAAEQGHTIAMFNLGLMQLKGDGIPQDQTGGTEWMKRAARGGESRAQELLKSNGVEW